MESWPATSHVAHLRVRPSCNSTSGTAGCGTSGNVSTDRGSNERPNACAYNSSNDSSFEDSDRYRYTGSNATADNSTYNSTDRDTDSGPNAHCDTND